MCKNTQEHSISKKGKCPPPEGGSGKIPEEDAPALSRPGGERAGQPEETKNIPVRAAKAGQGCFWYFLAQSDSSGRGAKSERFFRAY